MKPLRILTSTLLMPVRTATAVARTGLDITRRSIGWAVERAAGSSPGRETVSWATTATPDVGPGAAPETAADHPAAGKTGRKAPSRRAAVIAPALGLTEAEMLSRAADRDEG